MDNGNPRNGDGRAEAQGTMDATELTAAVRQLRGEMERMAALHAQAQAQAQAAGEAAEANIPPGLSAEGVIRLEARFRELNQGAEGMTAEMSKLMDRLHALGDRVGELENERKEFTLLKGRMESLQQERAWVESKLNGLRRQRLVVEKANVESGRLTALFWEMEGRIKEINLQHQLMAKAAEAAQTLETRLAQAHKSVETVERFEVQVKTGKQVLAEMQGLSDNLAFKLKEFRENERFIEEACQRAREAGTLSRTLEVNMGSLMEQGSRLEGSKAVIEGFARDLDAAMRKFAKAQQQWASVESLEDRMGKLEERVKLFQAELATCAHLRDEVGSLTQRMGDLRKAEGELGNEVEGLRDQVVELKGWEQAAERAKGKAEEALSQVDKLAARENEIHALSRRLDGLGMDVGRTANRVEEVAARATDLLELRARLDQVQDLMAEVDTKLQLQVQRRGELERMDKRLDQVAGMQESLESKLQSLLRQDERIELLKEKLGALQGKEGQVQDLALRLQREKEEALRQEQRCVTLREDVARGLREWEQGAEALRIDRESAQREVGTVRDQFQALLVEIAGKVRELDQKQRDLGVEEAKLRDRVAMIGEAQKRAERESEELERRTGWVKQVEGKVEEIRTKLGDVEGRFNGLREEHTLIDATRQSIENLHSLMNSAQEKFNLIKSKEGMVLQAMEAVRGIGHVMGEIEGKVKSLARERAALEEAEKQSQSLQIMVDELKAEARLLAQEEERITAAAGKVGELQMLLGEAESTMAALKRARAALPAPGAGGA